MEPRWRSLLMGTLSGVAIALLGYSWGIRGGGLHGLADGLFFLLIVASLVLHKLTSGDPVWSWRWAATVATGAATFAILWRAWPTFARAPMERHALPGFSVELPRGTVTEQEGDDKGFVQVKATSGGLVALGWGLIDVEGEPKPGVEWFTRSLRLIPGESTRELEASDVAGLRARTFAGGEGERGFRATTIPCADGVILVTAAPDGDAVRSVHARVLASFRCE